MTIQAGRLRHRVLIQQYVELTDSDGDVIQDPNTGEVARDWQDVAEVWAAIEPLSVREFIQSDAKQSQVTTRIVIRYMPGINAGMRVRKVVTGGIVANLYYNIHGVLQDMESGYEYITLPCSEGVSVNGQ